MCVCVFKRCLFNSRVRDYGISRMCASCVEFIRHLEEIFVRFSIVSWEFWKKERKVVRRNSWIREIIHSISYLFSESSILKFVLKFFFFFSIPFRNFLIFVDRKHPSSSFPFLYSSFSLFLPPSPFFRFVLTDCFTFLSPATILLLSPHHLHSLPSPVQKLRYKFN